VLKQVYVGHEPIIVITPYGEIYIESIKSSKELAVTVSRLHEKVRLNLATSDKISCECEPCEDLRKTIEG
jgi:hypothetical protein